MPWCTCASVNNNLLFSIFYLSLIAQLLKFIVFTGETKFDFQGSVRNKATKSIAAVIVE